LIIPAEVDTYVAFLEDQRHLVKLVWVLEKIMIWWSKIWKGTELKEEAK